MPAISQITLVDDQAANVVFNPDSISPTHVVLYNDDAVGSIQGRTLLHFDRPTVNGKGVRKSGTRINIPFEKEVDGVTRIVYGSVKQEFNFDPSLDAADRAKVVALGESLAASAQVVSVAGDQEWFW